MSDPRVVGLDLMTQVCFQVLGRPYSQGSKSAFVARNGRAQMKESSGTNHAALELGLSLVDQLHLPGYRAQPARTRKHGDCDGRGCAGCAGGRVESRQEHAARNYSTLLVFRKGPS